MALSFTAVLLTLCLYLPSIIRAQLFSGTVINGNWSDDFNYDILGFGGWNRSELWNGGTKIYHGYWSSFDYITLSRYFQCAYESTVTIIATVGFDACSCPSNENNITITSNDVILSTYDITQAQQSFNGPGNNGCNGGIWFIAFQTLSISNIPKSTTFDLSFHVLKPSKSCDAIIYDITIFCNPYTTGIVNSSMLIKISLHCWHTTKLLKMSLILFIISSTTNIITNIYHRYCLCQPSYRIRFSG